VNSLAAHYSRFRVAERLLLTGHSHQAWPDVAFDGQQRAWLDAAERVDGKWERAEEQARLVRDGFARLLHDRVEHIALGHNTHELVVRWLSALALRARPRLVTTDGEFHTIRRQVDRLAEEGIEIVKVPARPAEALADRVARAIDDRTACAMISSVLFETAEIVPGLDVAAAACRRHGAALLVDAYHHLNVVPFDLAALALQDAFVIGGGYKYCQLGEGNCFLRVPPGCNLRPVITGWFAELGSLEARADARASAEVRREPDTTKDAEGRSAAIVSYGRGAAAFAGATYDPTSHYRAAAVFGFHEQQELTPFELRRISQRQTALLQSAFESLDVDVEQARIEPIRGERRAGFVAIRAPAAPSIAAALRSRGVFADARGEILRLGPAPYLRDDQLTQAVEILGAVLKASPR
jgi:kynureninase